MRVLNFGVFLERAITDVFAILIERSVEYRALLSSVLKTWVKKREMRITKELEYLIK